MNDQRANVSSDSDFSEPYSGDLSIVGKRTQLSNEIFTLTDSFDSNGNALVTKGMPTCRKISQNEPNIFDRQQEDELVEQTWYVGVQERDRAEQLLCDAPRGTFLIRHGRASKVFTLKYPVSEDKIYFHIRIKSKGNVRP